MGLSCDQITDLLPVWDGVNCAATQDRVSRLIVDKQSEIRQRIAELEAFAEQLDEVRSALESEPAVGACRTDLTCCVPESRGGPVAIELSPRR
jgi:DNA-binding transcriptional MerR regulator